MNLSRTLTIAALAGALGTALSACGGGGGSGSDSSGTQISYSPSQVTATGANLAYQQFTVDATVSNPPLSAVYVMILADKPVIVPVDTSITSLSTGKYRASFTIDSMQPAGTYTGNFTLSLCSDAQCANKLPISGATLPYSITILPDPLVSIAVNGTARTPTSNGLQPIHVGDVATITTNIATTWPLADPTSGYQIVSSTPTSFTIQFASTSTSTTPEVHFVTAGGQSLVDFEFSI